MTNSRLISISIVSHLQNDLVRQLLQDIQQYCVSPIEVILTINVPGEEPIDTGAYRFPVTIARNELPRGFGANHNAAFKISRGDFFCVMNPDIRFDKDPFPALLACLQNPSIGVAAPVVVGESGAIEDSARRFPTPLKILCKVFGGCKGGDYVLKDKIIFPDWVGGMFMLFRRETFEQLGGFDQRYFLYYEDVDLCARLRLLGYETALCPDAKVVHHAHRSSHRNFKYLTWHLASMLRFFASPPFLKVCWMRLTKKYS
jgi:N-acetylglucosaminyl-diphospho-decaprenol L-rhamnosyltransferase